MNPLAGLAVAALLTASSVLGQGLYSPPWVSLTEGSLYGYYLGRYPAGRYQMGDGHSQSPNTLKSLSLRVDTRSYNNSNGSGRSWSNVRLTLGKTDLAKFTPTWTLNRRGNETMVFSAAVGWPTRTGFPIAPVWGGGAGQYQFPFKTSYSHTGGDMLVEFEFAGGVLSNKASWSSSASRFYWFDGYGVPSGANEAEGVNLPPVRLDNNSAGVTTRCNDTEYGTTTNGSYAYAYAAAYGALYGTISWRNKVRFYSYSYYTARNAPVIHAYGFLASKVGFNLNTGCNRLHAAGPLQFLTMHTLPKSLNSAGYSGYYEILIPWAPGLSNLTVVTQAGWADSKDGRLRITQARELTLPAALPPTAVAKRVMTHAYPTSSGYGPTGMPINGAYYANPAFRYGL